MDEIVKTGYKPIVLNTYYPAVSDYPWTGHSTLSIPIYNYNTPFGYEIFTDRRMSDKGYNLFTRNCANATIDILNSIYGTNEKPWLFTTPGDVQDYAIEKLGGIHLKGNRGRDKVLIPVTEDNIDEIRDKTLQFVHNYYNNNSPDTDATYILYDSEGNPPYNPDWSKLIENYLPKTQNLSSFGLANAYKQSMNSENANSTKALGGPLV